jgi:hypothetical protein
MIEIFDSNEPIVHSINRKEEIKVSQNKLGFDYKKGFTNVTSKSTS